MKRLRLSQLHMRRGSLQAHQSLLRRLILADLVVLAILPILFVVFTDYYLIDDLKVEQEGLVLSASWEDNHVGKYHVVVSRDDQVVCEENTEEPRFSMDLTEVEKPYKVAVTSRLKGGVLGRETREIDTQKADQNIYLDHYLVEGFEKKHTALSGESKTRLRFRSSDEKVATVTRDGKIKYGKSGTAKITVTAAEDSLYNEAKEVAVVNVYPTKLKTPKLKLGKENKSSDVHTSVNWDAVPYASKYVVSKYDPWTGTMKEVKEVRHGDPLSVEIQKNDETYVVQAKAKLLGKDVTSDESEPLDIKSGSHDAEAYESLHILDELTDDKLEEVVQVQGEPGTTCPQSFSYTGSGYLLAFTNKSGNKNALVEYSDEGERLRAEYVKMGHANGSTYNPVTGKVYTLKRHLQIKSRDCKTFSFDDFSGTGTFKLPKMASGISYDTSNDKFYLSGGASVFVTDGNFNMERTIRKVIRRKHTQDTGGANGVALCTSWNGGSDSYVDLYRVSDGGYLGTYSVPIGEIESATFVDKHLVVLINNVHGTSKDAIYRTKEVIPVI